jgi:hypothetical protein
MEYCILSDDDPTVLAAAVNTAIVGGWTPQGGVTMTVVVGRPGGEFFYSYAQALTRKRPFMNDGVVGYTFPMQVLNEMQEETNATATR